MNLGNSIGYIVSFGVGILGLLGVAYTVWNNKKIAKENASLQKKLANQSHENSKKNEIRSSVASYLSELTNTLQLMRDFFMIRRKLEESQQFLAQLIQEGVNFNAMLGSDPRQSVEKYTVELLEHKEKIEKAINTIEQQSQEILLFFKTDQESSELEELILYSPETLKGIRWVFGTNIPTDDLPVAIEKTQIGQNIHDIRTEMRNYLN